MTAPRGRPGLARITEHGLFLPALVLGLLLLFDVVFVPNFLHIEVKEGHLYGSLIDIIRNSAPTVVVALGMTLVIATGGVDLSVGATMAIASSTAALMINPWVGQALNSNILNVVSQGSYSYYPIWFAITGALVVAGLCGLWNGVLVAYGRIQPMVATLVLMIAGRGIAQLLTNAVKVNIFNDTYNYIGNGWVVLPVSVYIAVGMVVGAWLLTRRTAIGLFIESVGISFRSSFYTGIDEKKIKLVAYTFCGVCAGVAGMILSTSVKTSDANEIGLYFELDAILAVVIGGTLLGNGGRFSLIGSAIGGLILQTTTTSVYSLGVPASAITAVKAGVVIVVILLYSEQAQDAMRRAVALVRRPAAA